MARSNREIALDSVKRIGSFSEGEKDALTKAFRTAMFPGNWDTGTPNDGDTFVYDAATDTWEFEAIVAGDLRADGTVPLTANWNAGSFTIRSGNLFANSNVTGSTLITDNIQALSIGHTIEFKDSAETTQVELNVAAHSLYATTAEGGLTVRGGPLSNIGAALYVGSYSDSPASRVIFFEDSTITLEYEPVTDVWDFKANNITTTGKYVSVSNGDIDIEPHGTGNVLLGNFTFNADQTVGAGQDNYVLTYDHGTGLINLEASASGFADPMTTRGDIIVRDASNTTARLAVGTSGYVLTSDGTDIAWAPSISGVSVFTGLTDTPSSYAGQANKFLRVNAGATGIEFTSATPVTQVTASSPMASSGGTTPNLTIQASSVAQHGYMSSTQAAKLDSIEAGADVTDAANVAAAGAYMKTVTISTSAPSGGNNGDVWYQVV